MHAKHRLRGARDDAGLTQNKLSERSGVSTSTISNIECHRGPDVPRSEYRPTKTKLSTALKLTLALSQLPPGQYTLEQFVSGQSVFSEQEIYLAARRQFMRGSPRRHLRAVA